jgi:hypothetical protein
VGDRALGEAKTRLVIPSYDVNTGKIYLFKTPHHQRHSHHTDLTAVDVALATSAAPTYFPAHTIPGRGLWANCPAMVGVVEALDFLGQAPEHIRGQCVILCRGLNRSAVGKTAIALPSRWPQRPAPSTRTSLPACPEALRRAMLRLESAWGRARPLFFPVAAVEHSPQNTPLAHLFNLLLKQTPCLSRLRPPPLYPQGRRGLG